MTTSLNHDNNNKLHCSVVSGQLNLVQRLISSGCDPNSPHTTTGLRPIHFAASRGHVNLVQFLVQSSNVDIDAIDKEGEASILLFYNVLFFNIEIDCSIKSCLRRSFIRN